MLQQAQVIVIGGGAVGASCLFHLVQAGVRDCLLIEKDELTSGSTWHAAGNIPTYATSWLGMRAGNYAWRLYRDLGDQVGSPITYRHTGAFWPAHTQDRMDLFQHLTGVSKSAGFDLSILTPGEMEAMHPYYQAGESVLGGIHDPYEGDIDPSQLTQALAHGARAGGAQIARFTRVIGIERQGDEWVVETDQGRVRCETIVNATGFYGSEIGEMVDDPLPVATLEHQYLVTEPLPVLEADTALFPLVRDPDIRFYLRRERASLLLGSYGHPGRLAFREGLPHDFAHSLFEDSPDDILGLLDRAIDHIPLLAEAGIQRFVNGPIGYSPDALPLCGPAYGLPNFYHACGIQIGITHSGAVGKAIAEWVTQGETEWDYAAWDPRRFGEWADSAYAKARIVELYDLQYAIPFPHRLVSSGRPLQQTPLYEILDAKGAVFGQVGGWERAFWFDGDRGYDENALSYRNTEPWRAAVRRECEGVRDRAGIMDHGGFTRYEVTGPDAGRFLDRVFCGRLPEPGRVKLAYMLTDSGKIWGESTIARLEADRFLLCGPTLADRRDHDWLRSQRVARESVTLTPGGSQRDAALMVMGPRSRELLSALTDADLSVDTMPWMSVSQICVAGIECTAMRVSYVGELGWELHLASKNLRALYDAIQEQGRGFGLVDFGSYALNSMRLEKAYHAWGADLGTEYTPFDAGIEKFVDFNKPDFRGRSALLAKREIKPDWRFVGLLVDDAGADPLSGDPILLADECVGYVTSGGYGFRVDETLALGYIQTCVEENIEALDVLVLGKRCRATIVPDAFYDPVNERCRA